MADDRAEQIRIVVDGGAKATVRRTREQVVAMLGPGWRVQRLVPGGRLMVRDRSE